MKLPTLVNIHRKNTGNVGDIYSSPCRYFDFPGFNVKHCDINDEIDCVFREDVKVVICGGGGLLNNYFMKKFGKMKEASGGRLFIAWGIGQHEDHHGWQLHYNEFSYDDYIGWFNLIGIRDYGFEYPWVPCVSCMHPIFDKEWKITSEYIVFEHKNFQIPIEGVPRLKNHGVEFEKAIEFIASGETVITSSYHGAYWGILLGRKVIVFPFASKFYTLRYPVIVYPALWKARRSCYSKLMSIAGFTPEKKAGRVCVNYGFWNKIKAYARAYPEALDECRRKNIEFYEMCMNLIG
ncbi:MAG: hypothetical protein H5U10_17760 [Desulfacinum sp.]|jgi:hypothetical protein|nr:hypothetical protein [Desulfacinum sp.]MBZ4658459.1 hypothetical protein [Desulfacinum sp.]